MLLTITTTHQPATDLGYLLHKNPDKSQSFSLAFGEAHVFYPEAAGERCTAALLVDVDPIQLVRGKGRGAESFTLQQYVNDRPYAASSFLSVAIAHVFGTALGGRSKDRAELAETPIPLTAHIAVLPARGGEQLLHKLFAPLGYEVSAAGLPLDPRFPEWGESGYLSVDLSANIRLRDLLSHLYVLIPVLDDDKHCWVGQDEIDKLLRHGRDWLPSHPERNLIANRYLARQRFLTREAVARLSEDDTDMDEAEEEHAREEEVVEERVKFEFARPRTVVLTTPNVEYNVTWGSLPGGAFRHRDHHFEWTRSEFQAWAKHAASRFRYSVRFLPVGPEHPGYGPPTQMGVFSR